ncbi:hypothetical protein K458DRAFT_204867 [Lentithecium fluviatile CBS 122367]|uniref:Uncharacterized protein n=1 Tax=Lentithecium fluviatile CBS 122367 TaxID=1168545 RepID=A0A6G1J9X1_9PLEO|nr:hypothetical protein K458DRAFT_204867 [Lentithecium fluviatile CBS 122367]
MRNEFNFPSNGITTAPQRPYSRDVRNSLHGNAIPVTLTSPLITPTHPIPSHNKAVSRLTRRTAPTLACNFAQANARSLSITSISPFNHLRVRTHHISNHRQPPRPFTHLPFSSSNAYSQHFARHGQQRRHSLARLSLQRPKHTRSPPTSKPSLRLPSPSSRNLHRSIRSFPFQPFPANFPR